jgi:hypothetical protein
MELLKIDKDDAAVILRLKGMGGRTNEASFGGVELGSLHRLIDRGIVRRMGRFEIEIAPQAEPVHNVNAATGCEPTSPEVVPESSRNQMPDVLPARIQPKGVSGSTTARVRRVSYRKLGYSSEDRIRALAARIIDRLEVAGPEMRVRTLARALHAERFPEWPEALTLLTTRKAVVISGASITLVDHLAGGKLPDPYPQERVKRKRLRRPRTTWFEERLRRAEESRVPINEIIEQDRLGQQVPTYWQTQGN